MKALKKMSCLVLALCLALGVFMVPTTSAEAASKKATAPKTVHITPGFEYNGAILVSYTARGDKIKNLKSSSKKLDVKQTFHYGYGSGEIQDYSFESYNYGYLGLYAKKAGTYKVTFDVYSKDNKKKSHHTVTVKADDIPAISSFKFAGTSIQYDTTGRDVGQAILYTTKKKGKLSIKMTKGYKLKGVYIQTCNKKGERSAFKKVNLKKDITLGAYGDSWKDSYTSKTNPNYWYEDWHKSMFGLTIIRVQYVDKYRKTPRSEYFSIYRIK